jgi:hypothetical protein
MRIGCRAGFADDRIPPGVEIVERGKLDYLAMECLAERIIAREAIDRAEGDRSARQEPECAAAYERPSWSQ